MNTSTIQLREAKATLSALVKQAAKGEAAIITCHGQPQAVLLGMNDWERLRKAPSFGFLLANCPIERVDLAPRDSNLPREIDL